MRVILYETFHTDTLRHRETARQIMETLSRVPRTDLIIIDFSRIDFASRSFMHELLAGLSGRKIAFQGRNNEVERMARIVSKDIEAGSLRGFEKASMAV